MLTHQDLSLIRAALRYFCEELMSHDPAAYAGYLDQPLPEGAVTGQNLVQLRDWLATCGLCWVRYSHETEELVDGKLLRSIEEAAPDTQTQLAAILIPNTPTKSLETNR